MNNFGAPERQEAGDTNPVLGLSVQGSTFGDYARVSQQNFQLQNGTFLLQPSEHFLKHLSNIDPRLEKKAIDAAVKIKSTNSNAIQKLLDQGSEVDKWIRGDSGQFFFVNDCTGRAHTILASKIVDKIETLHAKEYLATSYFFRRSGSSKRLCFTASDIVASLARVCLTDRRLGPQLVSEIQGTYGSSIVGSDFEVTAVILMDILKFLHEQSSEQWIMFVVDGIQDCTTDVGQNGLYELATFLKNLAQSYPKSKWLISGKLLDPVEKDLRRLCDSPASVCLTSAQVAATFDLDVVVESMTALAQNINATPTHQRLKTLRNLQEDLSWVQYCHAARTWLSQSHDQPGILGYHRSSQEPFQPSSLGWHFAMRGFEDTMSSQVLRVYFSFSDAFPVDVEKASVVHSNILHPAQAVWCLFAQLAALHCEGYADLASLILSFPEQAQQDLKFVHSLVDHQKRTVNRDKPPNVSPVVSWYQGLLSLEMKRMATFTKALIEYLEANGAQVLWIVDCLELVNPGHATEFLTFLSSLECSFRVLLCFNDKDERECASWNGWGEYLSAETVIHEKTEYEECKSSLRFKNMHQRREQVSDPMHETNQWLWSNTTFQKWERDGGLLWISGKAGSGKSVLAKSIQRRFSSLADEGIIQTPWLACGWFYTARSSDTGTRHDFMMRSILYEILKSAASVFDDVKQLYRDFLGGTNGVVDWNSDNLEIMLDGVRASPRMPATVAVIDALDESENISGSQIGWERALRTLQRLVKDSNIRLVVLSRPEPHIQDILGRSPFINLQQHNSSDISILIDDGICRLREAWPLSSNLDGNDEDEMYSSVDDVSVVSKESPYSIDSKAGRSVIQTETKDTEKVQRNQMLDEIRYYLNREASGVILWVTVVLYRLQIDIEGTRGFTPRQLRDTLMSLPKEIERLYSYSLEKLDVFDNPTKLSVTKDILTWIVGSKRWAALELRELRDALAISEVGLNQREPHSLKHSRRLFGDNWTIFCLYIQDHCGPLVEILDSHQSSILMRHKRKERHRGHVAQPTWTIQLLHQTVNSFLQNNNRSWPLQVERNESEHYVITKSYLYLGIPISSEKLFSPPHSNPQAESLDVLDKLMPAVELDYEIYQKPLVMRQCCKEWPLARFALVIWWQTQPTKTTVPERLSRLNHDPVSLREERLHFPLYWAADMCFVPPYIQKSNIKSLIKHCCLAGNVDALCLIFNLLESYKHGYKSLHPRQYLMSGHDRQMIQGAIQAINYVEEAGTFCHHQIKRALHKLNERLLQQESAEMASNQKTLGRSCSSDVHTSPDKSTSSDSSSSPHEPISRKKRKLEASHFKTTSLRLNESNVSHSHHTTQVYGKPTSCQKITDALTFILNSLSIDVGFRAFSGFETRYEYITIMQALDGVYVPGYDLQRAQARRYDQQKRVESFDNVYHRPGYEKDKTDANADDELSLE